MDRQEIKIEALHNQLLAALDTRLEDIKRLAYSLPLDSEDEKLVAMVVCFAGAFLELRRHEAAKLEAENG
jgi:hypothetical protein